MVVRMEGKATTIRDLRIGDIVQVLVSGNRTYFTARVVAFPGTGDKGPRDRVQVRRMAPGRPEVDGAISWHRARSVVIKERNGEQVVCDWA